MNKTKLSTTEVGAINQYLNSANAKFLQKTISTKFSVGDVVLKKTEYGEDEFDICKIETELMDNSILPKRYLVIHVDEKTNISFFKEIKADGKLSSDVNCSIAFDDLISWSNFSYFEVDPHFTDATIFGEEFDVSAILKEETERRDRIISMNRAISTEIRSLRDAEKFIKELKSGEKFYFHEANKDGYASCDYVTFEFNTSRKYSFQSRVHVREWGMSELGKNALNSKNVYTLRSKSGILLRSSQLIGMAVFKTKPMSLNETE